MDHTIAMRMRGLLWLVMLAFFFGCQNPKNPSPPEDVLSDLQDVPDAEPDADADADADVVDPDPCDPGPWWDTDPHEHQVSISVADQSSAYYPYVYYHVIEWDHQLDRRNSYLYTYHVETRISSLLHLYHYTAQQFFLYLSEEDRSIYWVGVEGYRTGLEYPEWRGHYWCGSVKVDTFVILPPQRSERNPIFQTSGG